LVLDSNGIPRRGGPTPSNAFDDVASTIHQSLDGGALSSAALNAAFSYESPTVTSVTSCSTSGGAVGVYGTNFGNIKRDAGFSDSVTIESVPLTAVVVYNDTYLEVGSGG